MNSVSSISALVLGFTVFYYLKHLIPNLALFRQDKRTWFRNTSHEFWKNWVEPFIVAGILALVIRTYLLGPYKIPTSSMRPTFMEEDRIFVDKVSYRFHPPKRGDIIVFKFPLDKKKDFVKRLIGLPGDHIMIRDGKVVVNGKELTEPPFGKNYYYNRDDWPYGKEDQEIIVPPSSYFALGDNSAQSLDSRSWGFVPEKNLVGRAFFIWWPPKRIKLAE